MNVFNFQNDNLMTNSQKILIENFLIIINISIFESIKSHDPIISEYINSYISYSFEQVIYTESLLKVFYLYKIFYQRN